MEFKRDKYLNELISKKNNSLIKVITGARRSGKSYLLNNIFYRKLISLGINEKSIIRFSFDNDEHIDLLDKYFPDEPTKIKDKDDYYTVNSKKFRAYIKDITNDTEEFYLLLDEIQILDSFVGTLNGFLTHENFDVYVTGSNSQLLSSEIETKFRGRKSSIHVLPLSFYEFKSAYEMSDNEAWSKYLVTGGIPIVYKQNEDDRYNYLEELSYEVYLKDIIGRKHVKNEDTLKELIGFLGSSIGSLVSPSKLEKAFKSIKNTSVSDDTINNYINHFEDSFVCKKVLRYNIKRKGYIDTPYKVYFEDIGVRNALTHFNQIEETHLMENIIYNELRYRNFNISVGEMDVYEASNEVDNNGNKKYLKKKIEVDFVATKKDQKYYVQSCLNLKDEETLKREKRSLLAINDNFKKIIITKDGLKVRRDESGIVIIDIFDFLMNFDSLDY